MLSQCLMMVVKVSVVEILFYSVSLSKNRSVIAFLRMQIQVFFRQFMSPNLVLQQLISDRNSTLPRSMPISTFEASMVASQSMINDLFFSYIEME